MRIQYSLRGILLTTLLVAVAYGLIAWFPPQFAIEIIASAAVVWGGCLVLTRKQPLLFFVRYVNPVLCIVVLVICLIAGTTNTEPNPWIYHGPFHGEIPTYFTGKAIFCAAVLFLLGKLVEQGIQKD
jgi:hypothetical protein